MTSLRRLVFGLWASCLLTITAVAQTAATGVISGRVFNPATGEYVRNVEVRIEGTQQIALSKDGGHYRLTNAPIGGARS